MHMTEDDKAQCISQLVTEYSKTKETVALLGEHLKRQGTQLESLGRAIQNSPANVEIGEDGGFMVRAYGAASPQEVPAIDLGETSKNILELKAGTDRKEELAKRLKEAGLGNLI